MAITTVTALAGRSLRAQLKRTLLTILGVVLSVALTCASGLFGAALVEKALEAARQASGAFYATIEGLDAAQRDQVGANLKVDQVGTSLPVGYAAVPTGGYVVVLGADRGWQDGMRLALLQGRMPSTAHEIAVEGWLGEDAGAPLHIGDRLDLTLALGTVTGAGGFPVTTRQSFIVTGLLRGRPQTQLTGNAFAVVTLDEAVRILGVSDPGYTVGFTVRAGLDIRRSIGDIRAAVAAPQSAVRENTALLTAMGVGGNATMSASIIRIELILALAIIVATIAVIANTFSISVLERVRWFGILRCVGATPAQVRRLVLREALVVSGIGIPLGIGSGIGAVAVVIALFNAMSRAGFSGLTLTFSWGVVAGAAGLGLLVVFLSAWGPSVRAGRVPPLEAVLAPDRFVKERARRRRHFLMALAFGVSGRMAAQNLTRNRRRFLVTVASITVGVALFITFTAFLQFVGFAAANRSVDPLLQEVRVSARVGGTAATFTDSDVRAVRALPGVKGATAAREGNGAILLPEARATDALRAFAKDFRSVRGPLPSEPGTIPVPVSLLGVDAAGLRSFRSHVIEGTFDPGSLEAMNGVYITRSLRDGKAWLTPAELHVGDRLRVASRDPRQPVVTVTVAGFLDAAADSLRLETSSLRIVTASSVVSAITGDSTWTRIDVALNDPASSGDVARRLRAGIGQERGASVEDLEGSLRDNRALILQVSILLYGLVAVISLIGALSIINTIGTSLILRTRELGMLRAVGMSDAQMRGMVALEGVLYGLASSLPGTAIGVLLSRLLFSSVTTVQQVPWAFPIVPVASACAVAIALGVVSSLVPLRRLRRQSVVESIRAEE